MPRLLPRHRIDVEKWDACIRNSHAPTLYALSWYLDCVSPGWYGLVGFSGASYEVVLPIPVCKKWGTTVVQQPLFCQFLGIYATVPLDAGRVTVLLQALLKGFSYISGYHFHPENHPAVDLAMSQFPQLPVTVRQTQWLPLSAPYPQLGERYHTDLKCQLRQAAAFGWEVTASNDIAPLITLFRQHHSHLIPGGVHRDAYPLLARLLTALLDRKAATLSYASRGKHLHAGALFLTDPQQGPVYLFNAADATGRQKNARAFLVDLQVRSWAGSPVCFDFESPEAASVQYYYGKFGAASRPYYCIRSNRLPFPFRQLQELRRSWLTSRQT